MSSGPPFDRFRAIIAKLRAPDGCPWDRKQTFDSLTKYVLEEAQETVDAIHSGDREAICEELGDMLLQIGLLSQLGEEEGAFTIDDVIEGICAKLIRRHPHVFGEVKVDGAEDVVRNWQEIKAQEKREKIEARLRRAQNP
jgi:tetrapyrrole methylase family protein / MazG family protein